ncbi:hypothetical protein HAX54_041340 [Datura stramonium]|uniref:MBD domain-containing protein n=1 Tax=Datura stramonium TaxID=4076 RepID=A0ABS8SLE7_DATST|nr:hypothetical protein [Datura stramonium]
MNDQDESFSKNNVSQMNNQDKGCTENNVSQTVGEPNSSHEWLPPGWIVELKTRKSGSQAGATYKVYVDPSTGNKFYSKPEVSKYLKTMKQNNIAGEKDRWSARVGKSLMEEASSRKEFDGSFCSLGLLHISDIPYRKEFEMLSRQTHENGEVSSSNQKTSEDSKNIRGRGQSRISKRQKSDTDQALHDAGEDFPLNEKTSLGSKVNGAQSPYQRQKPGSDFPSAKSVSSVAVDCDSADELPPGWKKRSRH